MLELLARLRRTSVGGIRAPHKPLLLMWLFGRFAAVGSTIATYAEAEVPVSGLINEFGPAVASAAAARRRAAMPFVHLERELWDLRDGAGADWAGCSRAWGLADRSRGGGPAAAGRGAVARRSGDAGGGRAAAELAARRAAAAAVLADYRAGLTDMVHLVPAATAQTLVIPRRAWRNGWRNSDNLTRAG